MLPPRPPLLRNPAFHARGVAWLLEGAEDRERCVQDLCSFATRVLPFVSVVVTGDCCYQLCVHLLQGAPVQCPHTAPLSYHLPHAETEEGEALEGSSLLRSFGLLIAAVFAKVAPQVCLHQQSTAHKCTAMVDNDGGVWWTKQRASDREAVNLFILPEGHGDDADEGATASAGPGSSGDVLPQRPPKPDKPVHPLCYLYHGGGVDVQPDGIAGVAVRARALDMGAATVVAAALVAAMWDGGVPLDFGRDCIHNYEEMQAFSFELATRPSVEEFYSAFEEACIKVGLGRPPVADLTPQAARDLVLQLLQAAAEVAPRAAQPTLPVVVPLDGDMASNQDRPWPARPPPDPGPGPPPAPAAPEADPHAPGAALRVRDRGLHLVVEQMPLLQRWIWQEAVLLA